MTDLERKRAMGGQDRDFSPTSRLCANERGDTSKKERSPNLWRECRNRVQGSERSAGHRDRVCITLQASLFHGKGHSCGAYQRGVSGARGGRTEARGPHCEAYRSTRWRPEFLPRRIVVAESFSEYVEGTTLLDMITEDLVADVSPSTVIGKSPPIWQTSTQRPAE